MKALIALACVLLCGCAATPRTVTIKVPVAVPCNASLPDRPVMPTEVLPEKAKPHEIARAALAELSIREGYEIKLRTELKSCL